MEKSQSRPETTPRRIIPQKYEEEMNQSEERRGRRSIRLKDYDYSQNGAYFITICIHDNKHILGRIRNGFVQLSRIGRIANEFWYEIPEHFSDVELDEFIIMPNHLHGIICINDAGVGVQNFEPLQKQNRFQHTIARSIGSIIRAYKSSVTHWCIQNGIEGFRWQRNYWEHVLRNENKLFKIRQYIQNNPLKWHLDRENPERSGTNKLEQEIFAPGRKQNSSKMQPDTWKVKHRGEDSALRSKQGGV